MQYVTVEAESHTAALQALRDKYGSEAILHDIREVKAPGIGGFFGKTKFVAKAMLREKERQKSDLHKLNSILQKQMGQVRNPEPETPPVRNPEVAAFLHQLQRDAGERPARMPEPPPLAEAPIQAGVADLKSEIQSLRDQLARKPHHFADREFQKLADAMLEQEFSEGFVTDFVKRLQSHIPQSEWKLRPRIAERAVDALASHIRVAPPIGTRRVQAFVGPTGVGKTTTIAKLAARLKLQQMRSVTLVTLDNYRIAATEQLKIYGEILGAPVHVCKDPVTFTTLIESESADVVLVDTTGSAPANNEMMMKLKGFLDPVAHDLETHLVVSATARRSDMARILERFDVLNFHKIVMTKLDETATIGSAIELADIWHRPFSLLTNGQRVPDDFMEADRACLAGMALQKYREEAE